MKMLGVYLRLNMGYFGEQNYINEASSLLLDLCCISLYTCEIKYFYCCVLIASYVVYKSSSQKPAKIGDFTESLEPPLVTGLHVDFSLMLLMNWFL